MATSTAVHTRWIAATTSSWPISEPPPARELAAEFGAKVKLYDLACAEDVALNRCLTRTAARTASYHIDGAAFEWLRHRFEPLGPDEPAVLVHTGPHELLKAK